MFTEDIIFNFKGLSRYFYEMSFMRKFIKISVNERIVEIPFTFQNMDLKKGSKILDVGCVRSKICFQLASLGYKVWGIDLRDWILTHPNFKFVKRDICDTKFEDEFFNCVTAISTIEHVGLGSKLYKDPMYNNGDIRAIDEIHRVLEKGGKLIITIPFGKRKVINYNGVAFRMYDHNALKELLKKFKIIKEEYYLREGHKWRPVAMEEINSIESYKITKGVAMIVAQK